MKKTVVVLCLAPAISMGQNLPWTQATASACYAGKSTKTEVMEAIACLKANPAAGSSVTGQFKQAQVDLISADAEVEAAFSELERQKKRRLYVRMQRSDGGPARLMAVESASIGGPVPATVYDLAALDLIFTHGSSIFSADKTVPLEKVTSFLYVEKAQGIGELKTGYRDDTYTTDSRYQGGYPIKVLQQGAKAFSVKEFVGTVYPGRSMNEHWKLDPASLSGFIITFFPEVKGKSLVAQFEEEIAARQKISEQAERAAAEQRQVERAREIERKSKLLADMLKAPRGTEDSCQRVAPFSGIADPSSADIECQFGGKIDLGDLKSVGWLVVNKQRDSENYVREYYIRKVR